MPSKRSKNRKKVDGDITIQQFADSPLPNTRIKKTLKPHVNTLIHNNEPIEDVISDTDADNDLDPVSKNNCTSSSNNESANDIDYNDYHINIWFLVSEHITPEDTCRFALICKKTDLVVSSARFWLNLYSKFYSAKLVLPDKLKPDQIKIVHGIRARVICSLFFIYPPFVLRLSKQAHNLMKLKNSKLIQTWSKSLTDHWMFCYRFKLPINVRKPENNNFYPINDHADDDNDDILKNLDKIYNNFMTEHNNVFDNKYEGQHLLIILTKRFIPLPKLKKNNNILKLIQQPKQIIQKKQKKKKKNVNTGLEMFFSNNRNIIIDKVKYDTIINYRILNWWDPEFNLF